MTILYINDEHCTCMAQLRSYFEDSISYDSPLFYDLLDYARSGDLSSWLREKGESSLADKVDSIDGELGDSEYFSHLSALMTGNDATSDLQMYEKPAFSKCFKVEDVRQEEIPTGIAVHVHLKVLSSVNETYEFGIRTSWGTKAKNINLFQEKEESILTFDFMFHKRPNIGFKEVVLLADGKELKDLQCAGLGPGQLEFEVGSCRFKMICVEHGSFMMGTTDGLAPDDQKPIHQVTLTKSFYIGEIPVTCELWNAVMMGFESYEGRDDSPVNSADWLGIQAFINLLNIRTGMRFRLPTEAEWEFAARGGNKSNGYKYSGSDNIDEVAWYYNNSKEASHPVRLKKANELGIYDMCGNVWEICQDRWGYYSSEPQKNPSGPESGIDCVARGGSFVDWKERCTLSSRSCVKVYERIYKYGFRLALSEL